jgi:hypothetical protein
MPDLASVRAGEIVGRSAALLLSNQAAQLTLSRYMATPKRLRGLNVGIITSPFCFRSSNKIIRNALSEENRSSKEAKGIETVDASKKVRD